MPVTRLSRSEPGAAAVARLQDLPLAEAWWVGTLRAFADGVQGPRRAARRIEARLGREDTHSALARLVDLMSLTIEFARRPLMRHAEGCPCVGADEAAFALLCATAASGEREDATLIACLLVRPDVAPMVVSLAEGLGLELFTRTGRLH